MRMLRSIPTLSRSVMRNTLNPDPPAGAPSMRARVMATCDVVAEVNHLDPYSR